MFHICENNKVEPGRKVYVSSLHTILPKVLSFHPPKIKSSPDSSNICEYAALTKCMAKPLTAPCGLAWSTAQRVSRCLLPQSSSAPRHVDVPPHSTAARTLSATYPSSGWQLLPTQLSNLCPATNSCKGKCLDHFSSHEKHPVTPASVCARDGKPFQISFWGTCESTGISSPLLNRLDSIC